MKRLFLLLLLSLPFLAEAQNTAQGSFESSLPDSVKYVTPSFASGRVVYKNGEFSNGMFNISTLDQSLRFIEDGKELALSDIDQVDRVTIGGVLFFRKQNGFYGIVEQADGVCLCVEKSLVFEDSKTGAYGTKSSTSNIKEMQSLHSVQGVEFNLSPDMPFNIKERVLLYRDGKVYAPGKNQFKKLFPDKKQVVEEWFKARGKAEAEDAENLKELFNLLK